MGVAVVTRSTPDCSGVGHLRIVLDVKQLVRGDAINTVIASRPLYGGTNRFAAGDTVLVAIEPGARPAETVACVPLPARDGVARELVRVDADAVERAIAEVAAGCVRTR